MKPWEVAASDQLKAAFGQFAAVSRSLYDAYREEGFSEDAAFDITCLWNETFARMVCGSS